MTPYVFMIVIMLIAYYYLVYHSKTLSQARIDRNKKIYVLISGTVLFVVMALRHPYVGTDTPQYLKIFHSAKYFRWSQFDWNRLLEQEIGFKLYNYFLNRLGVSDQMYLVIYALIVSFVTSKLIYKYCKNPFWGFYFHITIGLFTMSMSGMRQTFACLICWLAIPYILRKKPIRFFLLVLLAASFHQSAIFFAFFYLTRYIKVGKISGWLMACFCVLFVFISSAFIPFLAYMLPEKYEIYGLISDRYPMNPILVVVAVLIPIFCLFFRNNKSLEDENHLYSICFSGSFCYAMVTVLSLSSQMIGRMGMYFYLFNVVLLGNIISEIEDQKTRYIVLLFAIFLPGYMFFKSQSLGISPYFFYWQNYSI